MDFVGSGKLIPLAQFEDETTVKGGNIEGCFDVGPNTKWVNLAIVSDIAKPVNPDGPGFHQIAEEMSKLKPGDHGDPLPRKERVLQKLLGFNTELVDTTVLAVVTYFIDRTLYAYHHYIEYRDYRNNKKAPKMCVQIHRGGQGLVQLAYLLHQLRKFYYPSHQTNVTEVEKPPFIRPFGGVDIEFRIGYNEKDNYPCPDAMYHVSISHVIGFVKKSGMLLCPTSFGQLDVQTGNQRVCLFKDGFVLNDFVPKSFTPNAPVPSADGYCENFLQYHIDEILTRLSPQSDGILSDSGESDDASRIERCAEICGFRGEPTIENGLYIHRTVALAQIRGGIFDPPSDALVFVKDYKYIPEEDQDDDIILNLKNY